MSGPSSTGPKSGFQHAATFVERALSFKPRSVSQEGPAPFQSRGKMAPVAPLNAKDLEESRIFPSVSDEQLLKLLPGDELEDARTCVKVALQDMHLNYDLDPKLLGERSEANRGNRIIALLVSRMSVQERSADGSIIHDRSLSGQSMDTDYSEPGYAQSVGSVGRSGSTAVLRRNFETHDLLKAIDNKDMETILAIRDANFDLLLDLSQGGSSNSSNSGANSGSGGTLNTPLGYAISLGRDWQGTSIILVGALSKFVNTLPDDEDDYQAPVAGAHIKQKKPKKLQLDPRTMQRLRKIRVNLKLAIDHSVVQDQNSLLASYLQVLVMSEGSPFLLNAIETIEHCLVSKLGDPVAQSRSQVLQFVTDSLKRKQDKIAAVKDYISNAQGDLLLMALWNSVRLPKSSLAEIASTSSDTEDLANPLPLYSFARDDRVTGQFVERMGKIQHYDQTNRQHTALLKLAARVAEALQHGTRRRNSNERLDIITAQFQRRQSSIG